jgi:hypothetical protein
MLQSDNTMRNVQCVVTARWRIYNDHNGDTLVVLVRDQAGTLVRVVRVELDQMCAAAKFSLYLINKLILSLIIGLLSDSSGSWKHFEFNKKYNKVTIIRQITYLLLREAGLGC